MPTSLHPPLGQAQPTDQGISQMEGGQTVRRNSETVPRSCINLAGFRTICSSAMETVSACVSPCFQCMRPVGSAFSTHLNNHPKLYTYAHNILSTLEPVVAVLNSAKADSNYKSNLAWGTVAVIGFAALANAAHTHLSSDTNRPMSNRKLITLAVLTCFGSSFGILASAKTGEDSTDQKDAEDYTAISAAFIVARAIFDNFIKGSSDTVTNTPQILDQQQEFRGQFEAIEAKVNDHDQKQTGLIAEIKSFQAKVLSISQSLKVLSNQITSNRSDRFNFKSQQQELRVRLENLETEKLHIEQKQRKFRGDLESIRTDVQDIEEQQPELSRRHLESNGVVEYNYEEQQQDLRDQLESMREVERYVNQQQLALSGRVETIEMQKQDLKEQQQKLKDRIEANEMIGHNLKQTANSMRAQRQKIKQRKSETLDKLLATVPVAKDLLQQIQHCIGGRLSALETEDQVLQQQKTDLESKLNTINEEHNRNIQSELQERKYEILSSGIMGPNPDYVKLKNI